jgi:hypothetical protein
LTAAWRPPNYFAVVLSGTLAKDRDVAFWVEAARVQMRDHIAPSWGAAAPGVQMETPATFIPAREGCLINIANSDGNPDSGGFHGAIGEMPYGIVDLEQSANPPGTLTHEIPEAWGNPFLDLWVRGPDGALWAREFNDAIQRHYYDIPVELFGTKRQVSVSNFLLPNYFRLDAPPPYDWMGVLTAPFSIGEGGYAIIQRDGVIDYLATTDTARAAAATKIRAMSEKTRTGRLARALAEAPR